MLQMFNLFMQRINNIVGVSKSRILIFCFSAFNFSNSDSMDFILSFETFKLFESSLIVVSLSYYERVLSHSLKFQYLILIWYIILFVLIADFLLQWLLTKIFKKYHNFLLIVVIPYPFHYTVHLLLLLILLDVILLCTFSMKFFLEIFKLSISLIFFNTNSLHSDTRSFCFGNNSFLIFSLFSEGLFVSKQLRLRFPVYIISEFLEDNFNNLYSTKVCSNSPNVSFIKEDNNTFFEFKILLFSIRLLISLFLISISCFKLFILHLITFSSFCIFCNLCTYTSLSFSYVSICLENNCICFSNFNIVFQFVNYICLAIKCLLSFFTISFFLIGANSKSLFIVQCFLHCI
ncbi:hypothetical protein AGLY_003026 [Aphis glycines]|uniref:Uncharacterized protein n=1 Tax=Aphis glycines TaxID=307491 RepID=A0A6G0U1Z3_APHGL|nr:hypothetical protein AGLY_003026 [Aphis glycines]